MSVILFMLGAMILTIAIMESLRFSFVYFNRVLTRKFKGRDLDV